MDKMSMGSGRSVGKGDMHLYAEEGPNAEVRKGVRMPKLPKNLTGDEKKYLLAVERGDLATVRRMLQKTIRDNSIDMNCVDPLGRGALLMAIESENLSMVELLVVMGVKTADSLLHAIDREFVEAVELLLEHEELIHKEGELYSWENIDRDTATFTPEITPLILAAHRNNYEIVKILLDRGATLPMPHDIRCGCHECLDGNRQDCLRHSASRINSYKALASPSLIALTSTDPLMTAFELSWEMKQLSFSEPEFRGEYLELRKRAQDFAVSLLSHTRSSHELQVMLNFDPSIMKEADDEMIDDLQGPTDIHEGGLARLRLAISYKQKKFVSHSWVQQLLASIWYEGLPGFRQKSGAGKVLEVARVIAFAPFYCLIYMLVPNSQTGRLIRKPFMKFLVQTSAYLFFLLLLILVSQRVEEQLIDFLESRDDPHYHLRRKPHRGLPPRFLEIFVVVYLIGFIWEEMRELCREGIRGYVSNMWNVIDFLRNSSYVTVVLLRVWAYIQQGQEIALDPQKAFIPREEWDDFDPQLIAEGLFAAANIFSALKLVHTSSINPHLGPLQISLGRMIVDIIKFFFFYTLVLFAFACGLNQLLWYFADLEKEKCYSLPEGLPDWKNNGEACMKWRRFGNLFESSQSLFWASFGMVGLADFELTGIKSYTRFWGLLMFGSYSVINVIVLLNLLIAMMSNSYAMITEKADTEWKFARTKLWLSYFDEDSTLPSPFNLIPTPKQIKRLVGRLIPGGRGGKKSSKAREARLTELMEQAREYTAVMRALVWRYISGMHRKKEEETVITEDDVNEIKGEISTLRCDLVEMFRNNGMNVAGGLSQKQVVVSRKTREWERRLFRGFHVAPAAGDDSILLNAVQRMTGGGDGDGGGVGESGSEKFRRMARLALLNRERLARPPKHLSHIGRSTSSESFKSKQSLKKAMDAVTKMVDKPNNATVVQPSGAEPRQVADDDKHLCEDRKNSLLSVVVESHGSVSVTPTPSFKEDRKCERFPEEFKSETQEDKQDDVDDSSTPTPPLPLSEISLMDEPLPDSMSYVKATSPLQKIKIMNDTSPVPPTSSDEEEGGTETAPDQTTVSMENEILVATTSLMTTSSKLDNESDSVDINAETSSQQGPIPISEISDPEPDQQLSRDSTLEMDSVEKEVPSPSTPPALGTVTIKIMEDVPFVPVVADDDNIPLISVESQHTDLSPTSVIISPSTLLTTFGLPETSETSSSSTLGTNIGQRVDDVKTIKRPKPGGSWF